MTEIGSVMDRAAWWMLAIICLGLLVGVEFPRWSGLLLAGPIIFRGVLRHWPED